MADPSPEYALLFQTLALLVFFLLSSPYLQGVSVVQPCASREAAIRA